MGLTAEMDGRVKKLGLLDLKLAQGAAMCVALIAAKLFPEILRPSVWWFVGALVLCAARPMYVFFIKKE